METARMQLIKNNIIAKLGLDPESDDPTLEKMVSKNIDINENRSIQSRDEAYDIDEVPHPCMDGMAY